MRRLRTFLRLWLWRNMTKPPAASGVIPVWMLKKSPDKGMDAIDFHNLVRDKIGLKRLKFDEWLSGESWSHAQDMAFQNRLSHDGLQRRLHEARCSEGSENVYMSSWDSTAEEAVQAWLESTVGHRDNVLSPKWTHIGVSEVVMNGRSYWCAMYGRKHETS